jgi:isopenicillin N synthase-like dioxygenase
MLGLKTTFLLLLEFGCMAIALGISLPVIDISQCDDGNDKEIRWICYNGIDSALKECGTFIAIESSKGNVFKESFNSAKEIFSLNIQDKLDISMSLNKTEFGRGYIEFGGEAGVKAKYFEIKEGYSYGFPWNTENFRKENPMESLNLWPSQISKHAVNQLESIFLEDIRLVKVIITALLEVQLNIETNSMNNDDLRTEFRDALATIINIGDGDTISLMRIFRYFSSDKKSETVFENNNLTAIGSSPHTDWGLLTVIQQDGVGGLQFLHDNEWVDVPVIDQGEHVNTLILMYMCYI